MEQELTNIAETLAKEMKAPVEIISEAGGNMKRVALPPGWTLVWDKGPYVGMGDLNFPFKLTHEEVYIVGDKQLWAGKRRFHRRVRVD